MKCNVLFSATVTSLKFRCQKENRCGCPEHPDSFLKSCQEKVKIHIVNLVEYDFSEKKTIWFIKQFIVHLALAQPGYILFFVLKEEGRCVSNI